MQIDLRPFYNSLIQQNNFEWTTEHQTRFDETKMLLTEQISNTIPDPNQPFYASAMLRILASAQHYYNQTVEQIR